MTTIKLNIYSLNVIIVRVLTCIASWATKLALPDKVSLPNFILQFNNHANMIGNFLAADDNQPYIDLYEITDMETDAEGYMHGSCPLQKTIKYVYN